MKKTTELKRAWAKAMILKLCSPFPCEIAGSIRRQEPAVGDIDLVVTVPDLEDEHHARQILAEILEDAIKGDAYPKQVSILSGGPRRATAVYDDVPVNLWCGLPQEAGALLLFATGPRGYNIGMRARAKKMGMLLNEKGLWVGERRIAGTNECDIYAALGKPWKQPHLRGSSKKEPNHVPTRQ